MKTRKKKIMRMILVMAMVGLQLEIVAAGENRNYIDSLFHLINKQRKEIRSKNDFRPGTLSTAPGFGKRNDPSASRINTKYGRPQCVSFVSASHSTKRIVKYWLLQYARRYLNIPTGLIEIELSNAEKENNQSVVKYFIFIIT